MSKYKFGKRSLEKLTTCHQDIQDILRAALRVSNIDFGVSEGHRPIELQRKYFAEGKSQCDGVKTLSKHNATPSNAVDIYAWANGKANWDKENLCYIAGVINAVSEILCEGKAVSSEIRWGGNWDGDGVILKDQSFDDLPHFELK